MDRRFITVLGLAVVLALGVSMIFYQILVRRGKDRKTRGVETRDVAVATKPLPVGVVIKREDVKLARVAVEQFPRNGFSRLEEVVERPVASNILSEEAVLEGRLGAKGSGLGLAPVIPIGMRAVSVRVSDVAGVAGFVLPGLRVDVLVTGVPPGMPGSVTTTCLQNLLVLSAGQTIQPDAKGEAIQTPTVTLLASPEQAEVLTLAGSEGRIQLVLRNSKDSEIAKTPGTAVTEIYNRHAAVKPEVPAAPQPPVHRPRVATVAAAPPPAVVAPTPAPEIVVIRGNQRTVETVPARAN